jgi:hypothetical protein
MLGKLRREPALDEIWEESWGFVVVQPGTATKPPLCV